MTLLINVVTTKNVIQASDRRLTLLDGSLFNDEANKAVCVFCKDAHFAISYTGLATINAKRTDLWVLDYLSSIKATKMPLQLIIDSLKDQATNSLKSVHKNIRRTSFVLSGYRLRRPFIAVVSNSENPKTESSGEAQDRFRAWVKQVRGPIRNTKRGLWIDIFGRDDAVNKPIRRQIRKLARRRFFHKQDASEIADKLVSFILSASKTPEVGKFIGRNCMTTIIKPKGPILTKYHPEMNSPVQYMPHVITGNEKVGFTAKNIEIWSEKPPWW